MERGRPKGTLKYRHPTTGELIGVYEWRKINPFWKKTYNKLTRTYRIYRNIEKDSIRYNQEFKFILCLKSKCSICGFDKWFVDIHHRDNNNQNNSKENLMGLCSTCHLGIHRGYIILDEQQKYIYNPDNINLKLYQETTQNNQQPQDTQQNKLRDTII